MGKRGLLGWGNGEAERELAALKLEVAEAHVGVVKVGLDAPALLVLVLRALEVRFGLGRNRGHVAAGRRLLVYRALALAEVHVAPLQHACKQIKPLIQGSSDSVLNEYSSVYQCALQLLQDHIFGVQAHAIDIVSNAYNANLRVCAI